MNTKQFFNQKNTTLIFLAGGGGYEDSAELDKLFFENIDVNGKILYCPAAMNSEKYPSALEWFTGLVRLYSDKIQIELLTEENANDVDLNNYDAIFIGGGNTYRLLDFIVKHGLDKKLKEYIKMGHGSIYGGSAGAIIFGKSIETSSKMDNSNGYTYKDGLNLLDGACVACHWPRCNDYIHDFANKNKYKIYCLPENCGMIFNNDGNLLMTIGTDTEIL